MIERLWSKIRIPESAISTCWKKGTRKRYIGALLRHVFRRACGEILDDDLTTRMGQPITHTACIAINAMFLWYLDTNGEVNGQESMEA